MKKKIVLVLFLMLVIIGCAEEEKAKDIEDMTAKAVDVAEKTAEYTLADYPEMFTKTGSFRGILMAGKNAPASDVVALTIITANIQSKVQKMIETDKTKLDNEVSNLAIQNAILVGSPCVNKHVASLMKADLKKCNGYNYNGFQQNKGYIKLYNLNKASSVVVVSGYNQQDTKNAAIVLTDNQKLTGTDCEVSGSSVVCK